MLRRTWTGEETPVPRILRKELEVFALKLFFVSFFFHTNQWP